MPETFRKKGNAKKEPWLPDLQDNHGSFIILFYFSEQGTSKFLF